MLSRNALGQLLRTPVSTDTGGPGGSLVQNVSLLAVVHDLLVVHNLLHVRPVIVDAHVAHEENLAVLDGTGERAEHLDAVRNVADPIPVLALHRLGGVLRPTADNLEAVLALEYRLHAVLGLRRDHHPVFRRLWHQLAPGRRATRHYRPRAVVAHHRRAVRREFVILLAVDQQPLAVLDHGHVVDVIPVVAGHRDVPVLDLRDDARRETLRQRVPPFPVDLTNRRRVALELHVVVAAENYAGTQARTCWHERAIFSSRFSFSDQLPPRFPHSGSFTGIREQFGEIHFRPTTKWLIRYFSGRFQTILRYKLGSFLKSFYFETLIDLRNKRKKGHASIKMFSTILSANNRSISITFS